jgi:hypothetical protein
VDRGALACEDLFAERGAIAVLAGDDPLDVFAAQLLAGLSRANRIGAEAAIGEADAVGLDELGRNGVMRVAGHRCLSGEQKLGEVVTVQIAVRPPSAATVMPVR